MTSSHQSEIIRHCRTFEALKALRISAKFGRLPNVTTVASIDVGPPSSYLASTIRHIVRPKNLIAGKLPLRQHMFMALFRSAAPSLYPSMLRASTTQRHRNSHVVMLTIMSRETTPSRGHLPT
ncbi:hypothetical protein MTO96_015017 [Rhipicephalus appendiculatus]